MTVRSVRSISKPERAPQPRTARDRAGKGANLLFLVLAVVGTLHVGAMFGVEIYRAWVGRHEVARLTANITALERERDALLAVIHHADDAVYREQLARCLGFVMPDETRYLNVTGLAEPLASAEWCR